MWRRWFPVGAVVAAALLLAPASARAQFRGFRGGLRPFPVVVTPPYGLPFTYPAYYPYPGLMPYPPDYYSGGYPLYSSPAPVRVSQVLPADYARTPLALPGPPRQRIEEFDLPAKATPAKETAAQVEVRVPVGAEVWFDGNKTNQTGAVRQFQSPPLKPGERYAYEVRARWKAAGQDTEETRRVTVRAGDRVTVDFTPAPEPEKLPAPKPEKP